MEPAGPRAELTRDAGGFRMPALRLEGAEESVMIIFGVTACLTLLSLALVVNMATGVIILYAFPIALSAWLFGRWIGVGVAGFAVLAMVSAAVVARRPEEALAVSIPALVVVTVASIAAADWSRRSESLVHLLNQRETRHRQMLETMTKVGQELVTSKRWEAIAEHSLASLSRDLELDMAWMFRRGGTVAHDQMSLLAFYGQAPARNTARANEGSIGHVIRTGAPLQAESVETLRLEHPNLRLSGLEQGTQGRLVLPVFVKGATEGAVLLACNRPRVWTDEEVGIASAIVNQLGLAMENASAYRSTIEALVRMEEISQMKSDFLKTASHELRTPLTVLMGYVEMMEDGSLGQVPEAWTMPMAQLRIKVGELSRLVQMMLDASRAEGPTLIVNLDEVDISEAVRRAVDGQSTEAERAGHRLTLHLPHQQLEVRCDRDKLLMVVRNLIENAVKYSPGADEVEIGLTADDAALKVWVADRGMGVPDAEKEKIFEQFHRVNNPGSAAIGGSGLGLFIVRQLVEVQGGRIRVEDRAGGGSVFSFTLPRDPTVLPGTSQVAAVGGAPDRRRHDVSPAG